MSALLGAQAKRGAWRGDRALALGIAAIVTVLGFFPISNLIPGGEHDSAYALRFAQWLPDSAFCLGIAIVAVLIQRMRRSPAAAERSASVTSTGLLPWHWLLPFAALGLYGWIARSVFAGRPLLIDELVQLFQARIFAQGRLWLPVRAHQEFFSILHVVDTGDKLYSQFPPGGPAFLALGELARAPWLVGPVAGAVCVALFFKLLRFTDPDSTPAFRIAATGLFAAAPFGAFMFGSHMNHATALLCILVGVLGLAKVVSRTSNGGGSRDLLHAFVCGLGFGAAATVRPLDAFAFALPAAAWFVGRFVGDRTTWRDLVAAGVGVLVPFSAMMWVNNQTTGSPLLFGYEVLWGKAHGLGFHLAPWGASHTPARGLELLSLYVTRLQSYLYETPFPSLLPVIVSLVLTRRFSALDRYLLASAACLGASYFAYWHDGFFLGPRFVFPWLPLLVLLTARLPRLVRERFGRGTLWTGTRAALASGAAMSVLFALPVRVAQYRSGLTSMREDYTVAAHSAGVRRALVFVRESWGAQLVARLWTLGVSRSAAAALYHDVDACALDRAIRTLEFTGTRNADAERELAPLRADSARVHSSPFSPDSTERRLDTVRYDQTCVDRINEDRTGYALLPPFLLERESGNLYARDLQARDSLLLDQYPGRTVYLLRRQGAQAGAPLDWRLLNRDSLTAAWRRSR